MRFSTSVFSAFFLWVNIQIFKVRKCASLILFQFRPALAGLCEIGMFSDSYSVFFVGFLFF